MKKILFIVSIICSINSYSQVINFVDKSGVLHPGRLYDSTAVRDLINDKVGKTGNESVAGIKTFTNELNITASGASNSTLKIGSLEAQPYSLNNGFIGENIYFDGSNFRYRATGEGGLFYFQGREGQFRFAPSGSAGAVATLNNTLKFNNSGDVALGGNISTTTGNYTGAAVTILSTGNATASGKFIHSADTYNASTWDGSNELATKDAIRDKIESMGGAGSSTLASLTDVSLTGLATNDFLKYNGTAWINRTPANVLSDIGAAASSHSHAASDVTSGTFSDARIAASNVTQHQASLTIAQSQVTNLTTDLGNKQPNLQFKDEGTNIGTSGGVTNIDFTGAGVTASHSSGTVTVNIAGGGGGVSDGDKGDVVVSASGATYTVHSVGGELNLLGITSPSQYTTDQTDVSYTGSTIVRVSTNSDARVINSIAGGTDGRMIKIINTGSSDLILQSDDGSTGTAANRFDFNGTDVIIEPKESREFIYDGTLQRWLKTTYEYDLTNLRRQPMYSWDYMLAGVATANFTTTAVASGTATYTNGTTDHPGYMQTSSSTTTNSGNHSYLYNLQNNLLFKGGEVYECIYQPRVASNTNTTTRFGFLDATTSADAVDGAYFEIPAGSFNVVGKTSNNSTRTTSSTISTIAVNTWYRFVIKVNRAASSITFTIYDANGVVLGSQTNSANIPTAAGREFGVGYISTNVGTTATALGWLDYQSVQLSATKPMKR